MVYEHVFNVLIVVEVLQLEGGLNVAMESDMDYFYLNLLMIN